MPVIYIRSKLAYILKIIAFLFGRCKYKLYLYIIIITQKQKDMTVANLKRGTKVKNQYGETLTVLEVIGGLMIRTYEDFNNLYHCTKLFYEGKKIKA